MRGIITRALTVCALFVLCSGAVQAEVVPVELCTDTSGATIISFDCNFEDLDYTVGDPIVLTATWTVDAGAATFEEALLRHYTPKSKNDPAVGTEPTFTYPGSAGDNSVDISFSFSELHTCSDRNVEIGNGHFTLVLNVDKDGDGETDGLARYGVNIHVEDPQ